MSSTLKSAKSSLRKEMSHILNRIDNSEKKRQSEAIFKKITSLPQYKASKRISLYLSTSDEIDTLPILKDIFAKGKEAFIPRYQGKKMEMVKVYSIEDYHKLPLTKWNIKQPDAKEIRENALDSGGLDLIILPGVAFTKTGKRLGHGMGYYDKYLEVVALHEKRIPFLIAVAFNEQICDDVPTNEKDFLLDMVLTEKDNFNQDRTLIR